MHEIDGVWKAFIHIPKSKPQDGLMRWLEIWLTKSSMSSSRFFQSTIFSSNSVQPKQVTQRIGRYLSSKYKWRILMVGESRISLWRKQLVSVISRRILNLSIKHLERYSNSKAHLWYIDKLMHLPQFLVVEPNFFKPKNK
jgi:hypothetical protein